DRSGGHDLDFAGVAASFASTFADEAKTPFDEVGIGELQDYAIADASGGAQGFGAVTSDPDRRRAGIGPRKTRFDAIEVHGVAGVQGPEDAHKFLESFEGGGLFAKDAAGTVATAD